MTIWTYLHLSTHGFEHAPENLDTELKHLIDGADGVPRKTETEVLLGHLQEGSHFH